MSERFIVVTEENGWSEVVDTQGDLSSELWRYAWEAQDRADEMNGASPLTSPSAQGEPHE